MHLAGDKPRGRLEKLFDFDNDYAPLQQTWTYYQEKAANKAMSTLIDTLVGMKDAQGR
ncbi:hypothetical protein FRC0360_00248 [Corynebacterium diphtheriae]|nr:hypothetical protein NY055_04325 [Corynebacterium diphtheriae bv. mitis]CAB0845537.1 hypothetical protein FRC0360_00248 [Corynebacterium diphtheriae]CAB0994408.1 hypothetical protein FRC0522_00174 [Corynebacterium diphtheriae]